MTLTELLATDINNLNQIEIWNYFETCVSNYHIKAKEHMEVCDSFRGGTRLIHWVTCELNSLENKLYDIAVKEPAVQISGIWPVTVTGPNGNDPGVLKLAAKAWDDYHCNNKLTKINPSISTQAWEALKQN